MRPSPLLPGEEYAGPALGFFDEDLAVWDDGMAEEVHEFKISPISFYDICISHLNRCKFA